MLLFEMSIIEAKIYNDSLVFIYQNRADSFYNASEYNKAILDCERILFFSSDYNSKKRALLLKSDCYKQAGEYDKSLKCLKLVPTIGLERDSVFDLYYNVAVLSYLAKDFEESATQLIKLEFLDSLKSYSNNCFLVRILVLNEMGKWDSAKRLIEKSQYFFPEQKIELINAYKNKPKIFNKKRLEWYSRIIPGSGQVIIGRPFEGFASFILCAASLSFGVYNVYYSYYFTGYFLGAGFLNGFYYGGIRRFNLLVENENQRRIQNLNFKISNIIK